MDIKMMDSGRFVLAAAASPCFRATSAGRRNTSYSTAFHFIVPGARWCGWDGTATRYR